MKKALVTGANGFVGSALVRELVKNNVEVIALDRDGCNNNIRWMSYSVKSTADFLTVHCVLSISIPTRIAFRTLLSSHILRKRALPESPSTRKFPSRM